MGFRENLKGRKFNKLQVIDFYGNKKGRTYWQCKCDCGKVCILEAYKIKSGHTKSCGCLGVENKKTLYKYSIKHKKMDTKLYRVWQNMKRRCYTASSNSYKNYGARGIIVCEEWKNDFLSFYNWAIENGYRDDLTIDRIDVNGNYEPSNCRWATVTEQANNKRNNRFIQYKGEKHTIAEWSKILKIKRETLRYRIKHNFPLEKVFSTKNFGIQTQFKRKEN